MPADLDGGDKAPEATTQVWTDDPALQAIEAGNNRALPHVAACCSKGRMALFSDSRTKVSACILQQCHICLSLMPRRSLSC